MGEGVVGISWLKYPRGGSAACASTRCCTCPRSRAGCRRHCLALLEVRCSAKPYPILTPYPLILCPWGSASPYLRVQKPLGADLSLLMHSKRWRTWLWSHTLHMVQQSCPWVLVFEPGTVCSVVLGCCQCPSRTCPAAPGPALGCTGAATHLLMVGAQGSMCCEETRPVSEIRVPGKVSSLLELSSTSPY